MTSFSALEPNWRCFFQSNLGTRFATLSYHRAYRYRHRFHPFAYPIWKTLVSANMTHRRRYNSWPRSCLLRLESDWTLISLLMYPRSSIYICPSLNTFTFNADWQINPTGAVSNITKRPIPVGTAVGQQPARIGFHY